MDTVSTGLLACGHLIWLTGRLVSHFPGLDWSPSLRTHFSKEMKYYKCYLGDSIYEFVFWSEPPKIHWPAEAVVPERYQYSITLKTTLPNESVHKELGQLQINKSNLRYWRWTNLRSKKIQTSPRHFDHVFVKGASALHQRWSPLRRLKIFWNKNAFQ